MSSEDIALVVGLTLSGGPLLMLALGKIFKKSIGHDVFGWHDCTPTEFDGASMVGKCKYCGKKCLMDSTGDWFTIE